MPSREGGSIADGSTATAHLSLLTFNIGAAALPRAAMILRWLRSRRDDALVLTETSAGPGTEFIAQGLLNSGYAVVHDHVPGERGVLVATRTEVSARLVDELNVTLPSRVAGIVLRTNPRIAILGVYIPSRDRSSTKVARKEAFIASLLKSVRGFPPSLRNRLIIAGDYNAVGRQHEPRLPGFFPWEYGLHDELEQIGLTPAHQLRPGREHPHSWIGRTGLGYLYDYVHVGVGLHHAVERCAYLHGPRERRLSDHAALSVRLRLG